MPYLLDTDWIVDCLNDREGALHTVRTFSRDGLYTSIVTYAELYQGAYYARHPALALRALAEFLQGIPILDLTGEVAERFGVLRGGLPRPHRQQIGDMDLLIAATALVADLTLVTRNVRDFSLVPGLKVYSADTSSPEHPGETTGSQRADEP
jgi:tRNA(fMet)-specific endonuclease VapC